MLSYDAVESKKSFNQIEKVVLRTKKEWEATFDALPDMLILANSAGRISRCNQATIRTFHSKYGDLVGHLFTELFPEARGANAAGIDIQLFEDRHWYRVYSIPVNIGSDARNHVYLFHDISKRKSYELEILKEEQYYEALFHTNPDCVVVLDRDRRIRQANPVFELLFGYTEEDVKGLYLEAVITPTETRRSGDILNEDPAENLPSRICNCRKKDGSRAEYAIIELPVALNGIDYGWMVSFRTVQAQPAVELLSIPRDELIEKLNTKLRPPLNNMLELINILDDVQLSPEQADRVAAAKQSACSLLQMLIELRNMDTQPQMPPHPSEILAPEVNQPVAGVFAPGIEFKPAEKKSRTKLRILLVEDNPINQKLAMRLLQRPGHFVRIADNGHSALRILSQQPFDLVLMDVQMPEMDGLEATRQIRAREREGQHQIIVAMTAEGPGGDPEKCRQAGMDDFIAKPLDVDRLFDLLDRFQAQKDKNEVATGSPLGGQAPDDDLLDIEIALPRFGGEITVYFDFLLRFIKQLKQTDQKLRAAYKKGDVEQLHALSHGLKGTAANFEATAIRNSASALEELTANNTLVGAYTLINDIARQIPLIEAFYHNHVLMQKREKTPLSFVAGSLL